jgi:AP-2 complex subunit mu-1
MRRPPRSDRAKADNAVELDDCQFHQCVRLGKFDSDRSISFIPPDGEFELMRYVRTLKKYLRRLTVRYTRYRSTTNINLPFKLQTHVVEPSKSRVEYAIHLKANFDPKLNANDVVLRIPTPLNTTSVNCKVQIGKAKYVPAENIIIWK